MEGCSKNRYHHLYGGGGYVCVEGVGRGEAFIDIWCMILQWATPTFMDLITPMHNTNGWFTFREWKVVY